MIVLLPLVTLPARLKVIDLLLFVAVAAAESVTVPDPMEDTVVPRVIPLELSVITIPVCIPVVLLTVTAVLPLVQLPVVVTAVGSVNEVLIKLLVLFVFGPTDSRLPV